MRLAEWCAAVHTSSCLNLPLDLRVLLLVSSLNRIELSPIQHSCGWVAVWLFIPRVIDESTEFFNGLIRSITALYSGRRYEVSHKSHTLYKEGLVGDGRSSRKGLD